MKHLIVAKTLKSNGFEAKVLKSNKIEVSLNRPINTMEVRAVLDSKFDGIAFNLTRNGQMVIVEVL